LSHLLLAFELRLELGNLFLELKDLKLLLYIFKLGVHRSGGSFSSVVVLVLRAFWNLLLVGWRNFHGNFFDVFPRLQRPPPDIGQLWGCHVSPRLQHPPLGLGQLWGCHVSPAPVLTSRLRATPRVPCVP
jgi:hypothetical protein